jgi:hypothetical protein
MKTATQLAVLAVAYGCIEFLLYRNRVVNHSDLSDFWIFYLPTLVDLLANGIIVRAALPAGMRPSANGAGTFVLALLATILSMGVWTTVAFNIYGT